MEKIKRNNWFVKDNELWISLMNFHVKIKIVKNDGYNSFIYYRTEIKDKNYSDLVFHFYSLEDAISFTENIVNKSNNNSEVFDSYKALFQEGRFKNIPNSKKKTLKK